MTAKAIESARVAELPGGPLPYTLRRSRRARALRLVVHPDRGVVVTVPATREDIDHGEHRAVAFLGQREAWVRRHVDAQAAARAAIAARGGGRDGGCVPYLGELHRIAVVRAPQAVRTSRVERATAPEGPRLMIHRSGRDRRSDAAILEAWFREEARRAIDLAIARHAGPFGVAPTVVSLRDPRTRWGSASRTGRLSLSWRLILAPPEALETVVVHELAHLKRFGHGPRFWALVATRRPDHATWRRWLHDHALELHAALD